MLKIDAAVSSKVGPATAATAVFIPPPQPLLPLLPLPLPLLLLLFLYLRRRRRRCRRRRRRRRRRSFLRIAPSLMMILVAAMTTYYSTLARATKKCR